VLAVGKIAGLIKFLAQQPPCARHTRTTTTRTTTCANLAAKLHLSLPILESRKPPVNLSRTDLDENFESRASKNLRAGCPTSRVLCDFEETADGKIKLEDYDMTDLTIRVIDQMRKASGWEPLPRDIRETYARPTPPGLSKTNRKKTTPAAAAKRRTKTKTSHGTSADARACITIRVVADDET
jgi:hypothetical protein